MITLSPHAQELERLEREAEYEQLMQRLEKHLRSAERKWKVLLTPTKRNPMPNYRRPSRQAGPRKSAKYLGYTALEWSIRLGVSREAIYQQSYRKGGLEKAIQFYLNGGGRGRKTTSDNASGTGGGSVARDQTQMEFSHFKDVN